MSQNCCIDRDTAAEQGAEEKGALIVSFITLATMAMEIVFGLLSGSMALLADGIHMGTHALALFVTVGAYLLARRFRADPSFSFGTGKVGVLGGYTNAILLGLTSFFMIYESVERILSPKAIGFDEAIIVAILGLAVNAVCAFILQRAGGHVHHHGHDHEHEHEHEHEHAGGHADEHEQAETAVHGDANLKAAFLHVVADALTSVLAILALLAGKYFDWVFLDPAVGLLGAIMILRWAWGLLRDTGGVLLDFGNYGEEISGIEARLEAAGAEVLDLHLWRYSERERSLVLSLRDPKRRSPAEIRALLGSIPGISHITIEVHGE